MTTKKSELNSVEDLALTIGLLVRRIRANAPPELREFSWTQKAVLSRLEKEGSATSADLARAESIKPQSMGTAIASLEKMGLVERNAHPTDGRQLYIKLTAKGLTLVKSTREAKHTWLSNSIAQLDKRDQTVLFKAGEVIKKIVK
ncbi:MAG: MarR family transcriptional regulator [Ignavibacteria bacterium]|nr:MarR family transcriptional regulator [Ignavibacteria bacterium]